MNIDTRMEPFRVERDIPLNNINKANRAYQEVTRCDDAVPDVRSA